MAAKKSWLAERFADGLVFRKADARGKCFIEYLPAERAWTPIEADGYLHIDCLWVSGQLAGHGYADELLDFCIEDGKAQGRAGLTALSSKKKAPYLSDPKYLRRRGFQLADTAEPAYELLYLPFDEAAEKPRFKQHVKKPHIEAEGFVLYHAPNAPSRRSTSRSSKTLPKAEASPSRRSASKPPKRPKPPRPRSPRTACFTTALWSPTRSSRRRGLRSCLTNGDCRPRARRSAQPT